MSTLHIFLLSAAFFSHWYMMFFMKKNLGEESSDQSHDRVYNKKTSALAFASSFAVMGLIYWNTLSQLTEIVPTPIMPIALRNSVFELQIWQMTLAFLVYVMGFYLRAWAIRTLGRQFTYEIGIRKSHQLILAGPYKWLRHPSYTGYFLMIIGLSILLANSYFLIVSIAAVSAFFLYRIPAEETMLQKHFQTDYENYKKNSWCFFPGL